MLQNEVYMRKEDHKYFRRSTGEQLISWSRFIDNFFPKFDPSVARHCAGKGQYVGMSEQQVRDHWDRNRDDSCDHGNFVHDSIDYYGKNFKHKEGSEELIPLVESIYNDYKDYYKIYSEEIVYTKHGIAGTIDRPLFVDKNTFDIDDYKTNKKGIEFYPQKKVKEKWAFDPISHLPNCSYIKYALQASTYGYMLEEISGMKCRALTITYIPWEDKLQYKKINLPYLKRDVENLIDFYCEKIKPVKPLSNLNECLLYQ